MDRHRRNDMTRAAPPLGCVLRPKTEYNVCLSLRADTDPHLSGVLRIQNVFQFLARGLFDATIGFMQSRYRQVLSLSHRLLGCSLLDCNNCLLDSVNGPSIEIQQQLNAWSKRSAMLQEIRLPCVEAMSLELSTRRPVNSRHADPEPRRPTSTCHANPKVQDQLA